MHPHCHQRASLRLDDEIAVLKQPGLEFTVLDAGLLRHGRRLRVRARPLRRVDQGGERVLLPAVRAAAQPTTFIVTNGFSCREQIPQTTGRRVWHLAEILQKALRRRVH